HLIVFINPSITPPQTPTLLPYTTLFRSVDQGTCQLHGAGDHRSNLDALQLQNDLARADSGDIQKVIYEAHEVAQLPFHQLARMGDRKSTRLNSSHDQISYAVFCLKKKKE